MAKMKDLMAAAGYTAIAESFTGNKVSARPTRKFNAERYFAAKESIARVEAGFKGEIYEFQAKVRAWKAAGEDLDEIKRKISNGATDAWRKVKELIGKLLVMVEELIAGFTSKKGGLDKVAAQLERKSSDVQTLIKQATNNTLEIEESFSVELPSTIGGASISQSKSNTITAGSYYSAIKSKLMSVGGDEDSSAFCKALSSKAFYKEILKDATALRDGVAANKSTSGALRSKATASIGNVVENVGLYLGKIEAKKMKIKALKAGNIGVDAYTVKDVATLKDFLTALGNVQEACYKAAKDASENIVSLGHEIAAAKMSLNKIKNAPVKVTKTSKKSQENLQLVRLYCTRGAKGLNLIRTSYNAEASYLILLCSKVIKAQDKALKYVTSDVDEDSIKIRTFGKNTYR